MLLRQPRKPHVGMLGPSRRMIVDYLGFSPLAGNHAKGHADPARGFALPFFCRPLWTSLWTSLWPAQIESPSKFSSPGRQSVRGY